MRAYWVTTVIASILILGTIGLSQDVSAPTPFDPTPTKIVNPAPGRGDLFGVSLSVSGNNLLVGAPGSFIGPVATGQAYLFDLADNRLLRTFDNPSPDRDDRFGEHISLDGNNALIGAFADDDLATNTGAAYEFNTATGALSRTYDNPTPLTGDLFGRKVTIEGDLVLIGAPSVDIRGCDSGEAYLFNRITGALLTIFNPEPGCGDAFGEGQAIGDGFLVISAHSDTNQNSFDGEVNVYEITGTSPPTIGARTLISNPESSTADAFGLNVAVDGNNILIGAPGGDTRFLNDGTVYLFDKSGTLLETFRSPEADNLDRFGSSVALSGDFVLIGADQDDFGATNTGSAYLFDKSANLLQTFHSPSPGSGDGFGGAVALDGNKLVIGERGEDTGATDSGAVYVYTASLPPEPEVLQVAIDIKPGSDPNSVNCKANKKGDINGVVPIGISTDGFDATTIDLSTLTLNGDDTSEVHGTIHIEDSTAVIHVPRTDICAATGDATGEVDVILGGSNADGEFEGTDTVRIVKR